jgi:hypothetical protein
LVFPRVDLNLDFQRLSASGFRAESEYQLHRVAGLSAAASAKPWKGGTNSVDDFSDWFGPCLNEIDVFRIPQRRVEEEFVNGRSTPKGDSTV